MALPTTEDVKMALKSVNCSDSSFDVSDPLKFAGLCKSFSAVFI